MKNENGTIIISDMSLCQPAKALTDGIKTGCWRKCLYETINGVSGTMLFAAPEDQAGEIVLPINLSGWYRIYAGVNFTRGSEYSNMGQVFLRLSDEKGFSPVSLEVMDERVEPELERFNVQFNNLTDEVDCCSIYEIFWKAAELTSRSIHIRPTGEPYVGTKVISNISYFKLVPLTPEDEKEYRSLAPSNDTKRLNMMWCTARLSGSTKGEQMFRPKSRQFFADELQPVLNSDVGSISFEAIRGNICLFKTKTGDTGEGDCRWDPEWIDPLETVTQICHNNGIKVYAACRMIGAWYPVKRGPMNRARFYWEHPEFRKVDKDGVAASGVSLAFSGVRNFWINMLRETLNYNVDGVHIYFNRCYPYVLYEEPVIQEFIEKYGCDPRELPVNDERWIEHYASYTTRFIREIRDMLNSVNPGLDLIVTVNSAHLNSTKPNYVLKYTFDIDTWIKEGLVNIIIPSNRIDPNHIQRWNTLSGGKVKVMPDLLPRTMPGKLYCAIAEEYYKAGAWGLSFWDAERRPPRSTEWAVAKYLGHRECFPFLSKESENYIKSVPLKYLNGMCVENSFHDG